MRGTTKRLGALRKVIAERMMSSLHGSAQLTTVIEVDVEEVLRLRRQIVAGGGEAPSLLGFFARAAVLALRDHPVINSALSEESELTYFDVEHLGMAVDTPKGLMVPVIRNAGDLGALELTNAIRDVAERTRTGRIAPEELGGGTFTITNTGSRKALFDTPIINQPQSAILGIGAVVPRPVAIADGEGHYEVEVRSMMYLALSYDHRVVDGADAARYLDSVRGNLADPQGLLEARAEVVA
nr:2-oxo acid dehydrogenase subunit E2 [Nocardioides kongjuensis]